jgi:hypothetical protein
MGHCNFSPFASILILPVVTATFPIRMRGLFLAIISDMISMYGAYGLTEDGLENRLKR